MRDFMGFSLLVSPDDALISFDSALPRRAMMNGVAAWAPRVQPTEDLRIRTGFID
jgi:hypothetical protein